ncbi:MAG: hypothetical protein AB1453_04740, partial [Chloroflexota bacterium]
SHTVSETYAEAEKAANEAIHRAEAMLEKAKKAAEDLQKKSATLIEEQKSKLSQSASKAGEVEQ